MNPEDTTAKTKKSSMGCISIIGVVLVAALVKTLVKSAFEGTKKGSQPSGMYSPSGSASSAKPTNYEDVLRIVAERMSAQLPMKIDSDTIMDSVSSGPGRVFTYNYTVTTATRDQIDFDAIERSFRPKLLQNYKLQSGMKTFRDYDVELRYKYYDKNHEYITMIAISPKDF